MKKYISILLAFLATAASLLAADSTNASQQGKGSVELVRGDGLARAVVVIAENPTRPAQVAAREFIAYVKKITGVELKLQVDGAVTRRSWMPHRVLIGESSLTRELGLKNSDFEPQEYLIETRGPDLILMGRDAEEYGIISYEENGLWPTAKSGNEQLCIPLGSLYAVDSFLETYGGVRWYLPGEIGEVCPGQKRLAFTNIYARKKPWTRSRSSSRAYYRDPFHFYGHTEPEKTMSVPFRDMILWRARMKIGGSPYACNHSFTSYYDRFGKTHPEWWKDGKPPASPWPHPDYSNPDLIKQAAQDANDYFDGKYPDSVYSNGAHIAAAGDYFAVMPLDGRQGLIWSPQGEKLRNNDPDMQDMPDGFSCGWASDFVFNMVNQVALGVGKKHPDKWITCSAYAPYFCPPRKIGTLAPNVSVMQCGFLHRTFTPDVWAFYADNLAAWSRLTRALYVWEYYLVQSECGFTAFPVVYPHNVFKALQTMHSAGIKGMFFEASAGPAATGPYSDNQLANPAEDLLNHYITWKYLCDDSLDIEAVLDEHYRLFYGPAAEPMKKFFTLIEARWSDPQAWKNKGLGAREQSWTLLCPPAVLAQFKGLIQAALAAAKTEPYLSRVRLMYKAVYQLMERHAMEYRHEHDGRSRLTCPLTSDAPRIDGKLDDPAWARAGQTEPFVSVRNLPAPVTTTARVTRGRDNIYVAFSCPEPGLERVKSASTNRDDLTILSDDHVEIALDVDRTRSRSFLIAINAEGKILDKKIENGKDDPAWDSGATAAVVKQQNAWTVEVCLPLRALGAGEIKPGMVWGANFGRGRTTVEEFGEEPAATQWSPAFSDFGAINGFGVLNFLEERPPAGRPIMQPAIHYDFESLPGNKIVPDQAGVVVDGTRIFSPAALKTTAGGVAWGEANLVPGVRGEGLRFGGPDRKQYLEVALSPAVNLETDDFTLAFWYKSEKPAGILLHSTTTAPYWGLYVTENNLLRFALNAGGENKTMVAQCQAENAFSAGAWRHVVFMIDRGLNLRLYLDKKLIISSPIKQQLGSLRHVMTIGGPHGFLDGIMDEFYLFPGTFGQEEVDALYAEIGQPPAD